MNCIWQTIKTYWDQYYFSCWTIQF